MNEATEIKCALSKIGMKSEVECAREYLNRMIKQAGQDVQNEIKAVLDRLRAKVVSAVKTLTSDISLGLNEDDAKNYDYIFCTLEEDMYINEKSEAHRYLLISQALDSLDDLAYVLVATENLEDIDLSEGMKQEMRKAVNGIYDEFITNSEISFWRLIPLNKHRNAILRRIPEDERYLFPWYEQGADVPDYALSVIIGKQSGISLTEEPLSHGDYSVLINMIPAEDVALANAIQEMAKVFKLLPSVCE